MSRSLLDDAPVSGGEPLWPALSALAVRLVDLLPRIPLSSPILVSGDWGAGKTSLLRALEWHLTQDSELGKRPKRTVWFDAWHHENETALLPALLRRVWESTPEAYRSGEEARNLFGRIWRGALAATLRSLPMLATGLGAPWLAGAMQGLDPSKIGNEIAALGAPRNVEPPADPVTQLRRDLARLVKDAWGGVRPVVFVDDLDRCSPEGAIALLDSLRMLVAGASELGCQFVVALDRGVVAQAISAKFSSIRGYDGNRYLEKILPLSFSIPLPDVRDVSRLIEGYFGAPDVPAPDDDTNARHAVTQALAQPVFVNPRLMKRCINRFLLVLDFERAEPARGGSPAAKGRDLALAKWLAATERWPRLRSLMWRFGGDDEHWLRTGEAVAKREIVADPDTDSLLREPSALSWLESEGLLRKTGALAQLREAEARLQRWGL